MNKTLIDVSEYQGKIDWSKVKKDGIEYAIIRAGGRYGKSGSIYPDDRALSNISGALENDIKVGVYFFTQATTEEEAKEEALYTIKLIAPYKNKITLPIYIDTEYLANGRHNNISKNKRTEVISAFCKTIIDNGYEAGLYGSVSWLKDRLIMSKLSAYSVWVAQYNNKCEYSGYYDIWQYSSTGKVNGISGNVDMNIIYTEYEKNYPDNIKVKAIDTIFGKYGNGSERVKKLGKDYDDVQELVNEIIRRLN